AEVVRVVFDPKKIGYPALLDWFWKLHDPTTLNRQGNDVGTQYRSVIFALDDEQALQAANLIADLEREQAFPAPIVTELSPAETFWPAEDYHREYFARHGEQPYCQVVVAPKLAKFRAHFAQRRKGAAA
ncbi:MAG: peptide-methionine (S)-S-oxide reductase MsrA, partial [Zoogloea sp.]|nr:peptide-methionine (S)-S-oxide reductase MsrA [Zoogloea sp.]